MLENHLINTVDHIRTSYPEMGFCIMGDFNRMNINSILRGNNLKQIVTFPTRGNATLDLILTNIQDHYHKPSPYSPIGMSDHDCVLWQPEHDKKDPIHNSDKPWITPYIKNLISERQTAFAQSDSIKWRKLRNKVKCEIEPAKVKYNAERVRELLKNGTKE